MKNLSPLSPEVEALLAASRTILPLAPSVEARAISRAAGVAAVESKQPANFRPAHHPRWVFAAAAGVVVALGAAAYAARGWFDEPGSPAPARVAPVESIGAPATRTPGVAAVMPERDAPAPVAPPVRRIRGKSAVPARPTNAELQLLLSARRDVTRGEFGEALAVIAEHARRFRNGSLIEEREALRVKSLAGLGRHADAQRAAARFHGRFPHSVLLPTFERMTEPDR